MNQKIKSMHVFVMKCLDKFPRTVSFLGFTDQCNTVITSEVSMLLDNSSHSKLSNMIVGN